LAQSPARKVRELQAPREGLRQDVLFDSVQHRDVEIASAKPGGTPLAAGIAYGLGWTVCVRANAKNRLGA
jgi:hypothetical protein